VERGVRMASRKPSKKGLTRKLDKVVSDIVRSRGYCVHCAKTENLQCCHIFSRTYRNLRWSLDNVICLCASCHFWTHKNPILFADWLKNYLGELKYEQLKMHRNSIRKWTLEEMIEMFEVLKKHKESQWNSQ